NLLILSKRVVEESADFGIGYDGDADRAVIVDEKGVVFPLDVQLAAIIENEMEKNKTHAKKIITTIEASLIVKKTIEKMGALPVITPVGSLFVSKAMQKENAVFGGEPCGEYIFRGGVQSPDGILTGAKFAEIFCMQKKLSELREKYPCYPMVREKFECDNSKKYKIIEKIKKDAKFVGSIRDDDGIRIDQQDGWFLIRASGTEPFIRMTMEYLEKTRLEKMAADIRKIILSNLE
ncbi:MAG: phosphoglucosamine mutase, partial [Candidatus Paceibacterota bacterium]